MSAHTDTGVRGWSASCLTDARVARCSVQLIHRFALNEPSSSRSGGELGDRVVRPAPPRAAGANWRGALVIGCELHARGHLCLGLGDLLVLGASGVLFYPSLTGLYSRRDRFQSPTKNPSAQAAYTEALLLGWRTILLRRTWGGGAEEAGGKVG